MNNKYYEEEIAKCNYELSFENLQHDILNTRGYYKLLLAQENKDSKMLKSAIIDLQLAIEIFRHYEPSKEFYLAQTNLNHALLSIRS